jgi:adenine deaminase
MKTYKGNIADVINRKIFFGEISVDNNKISDIKIISGEINPAYNFLIPGFIDSHIHIESSMLIPSEFARAASVHGTVATVSDPHEIANVLGVQGIKFMIENGKRVPFKFYFGVPSCVPATSFETSGAVLNADDIEKLFLEEGLHYLSEMMNFPGVVFKDESVMAKLEVAKKLNKPIDGHAPGLKGEQLKAYVSAGITTDHEAYEYDEAVEKINLGMKILIREGSAAKNFDTLKNLISEYNDMVMLCSDDKHPDNLVEGHINLLVKKAVAEGFDLFDVLNTATVNPVRHYNLEVGLLQKGDHADFIMVEDLKNFNVLKTFINGELVAENGVTLIQPVKENAINNFYCDKKSVEDFFVKDEGGLLKVIEALDGQLITKPYIATPKTENGNIISSVEEDVLKMTVVNRYKNSKPAIAFIKNIGIKSGAIASSVAHDSHNIIAVGTSDKDLCRAVNALAESKGGIAVINGEEEIVLPLPVGGIMSAEDVHTVAEKYSALDKKAKELGSKLIAPFMTLSFMALLVIPALKLSDKGLFDGNKFQFTDIEQN